jgi:hypothetical protein
MQIQKATSLILHFVSSSVVKLDFCVFASFSVLYVCACCMYVRVVCLFVVVPESETPVLCPTPAKDHSNTTLSMSNVCVYVVFAFCFVFCSSGCIYLYRHQEIHV